MGEPDQATIERLEKQAKDDPGGYQLRLAALALLGYGYFALVVIGLLLLAVLMVALLYISRAFILAKFAILFLITIGLIIKSMWVKYERPEGIEVKQDQAPKLFKLVGEVQKAAGGPHIHRVLLDESFNCGIAQFPRLGPLGFYENILCLGLPLLDSLSVAEFKAVLAHEMGHLSGQHGKFACWIYHVRMSWLQTYINLSRKSVFGSAPVRKFANWFVPKFDLQSLALRREHEFAADKISAAVTGPAIAAQALLKTTVKALFLDQRFWPDLSKQLDYLPEPPSGVFSNLRESVHKTIDSKTVLEYLQESWIKHEPMDSHPSLSERVEALQPGRDWSDLSAVADAIANEPTDYGSAAEKLLVPSLVEFTNLVNDRWHKATLPIWKAEHDLRFKHIEEFNKLEELYKRGELTADQAAAMAGLAVKLKEANEAIEIDRKLNDLFPDEPTICLWLGALLISNDFEDGIPILEKAMKLNPMCGRDSCAHIAVYLKKHDRPDEAKTYIARAEEFAKQMALVAVSTGALTLKDEYKEHNVPPEQVEQLCDVISADPRVASAFLVARVVPEMAGANMNLLVVQVKQPLFGRVPEATVIQDLVKLPELKDIYVIAWSGILKNLGKACKTIPTAQIYSSKTYQPDPLSKRHIEVAQALQEAAAARPGYWQRNRTNIILAVVIGLMFLSLFFTANVNRPVERQSPTRRVSHRPYRDPRTIHYQNFDTYMAGLQRCIKHNWRPPRGNESKRTVLIFKVHKDGRISDIRIDKSSGDSAMDDAGLVAVEQASPFAPLPPTDQENVDIQFSLDYNVYQDGGKPAADQQN
jgi:TonB family protein